MVATIYSTKPQTSPYKETEIDFEMNANKTWHWKSRIRAYIKLLGAKKM